MIFNGFSEAGLDLLRDLPSENPDGFKARKSTYQAEVAEPAKAFVTAVGERLADTISPTIEAQPKTNGSIAPINNDLRFNPDAAPYKDHLLLKFWDGPNKKLAPTLWIRMSPDDIGFASGMGFDKDGLARFREAVAGDAGTDLVHAIEAVRTAAAGEVDVAGQGLKRVPAPYDADHPRGDLLKHKGLQVRWPEPTPTSVSSADFVDWCVERMQPLGAVHHWLKEHCA